MPTPALNIPVRANVDKFKQDMQTTSTVAGHAVRSITKHVIDMNAGWLASRGAAGAAGLAFGRVLGILGPIALGVTAVRDAFRLMAYATELAKTKIAEFNDVADQANRSGLSTDFFQRFTKSGVAARATIEDVTAALKQFNDVSAEKLGGSDLQQRIDQLTKVGNFAGNGGIAALSSANTTEEKLRAVVRLIDEAMQKGERLAALDLAGKAFGPSVVTALRANSGYLDEMLKRADAMSKAQIISPEDVGRAIELKERMEGAQKVLAEKWKPIQDDLAKLGMNYHESWVSITEDLAAAVGYATQLYMALKQVPDWFANRIGNASIWTSLTTATGALGLNSTPESMGIMPITSANLEAAKTKLNAALQNHANVTRGMQETSNVVSAVRGDTSKTPGQNVTETANQFDRASEAIEKHTARLEADARAVGLGAQAQAELRAEAQLFTAAQQAGLPMTQAMIDKIQDLAQDAGEAAEALAKARVASEIKTGRQTAFLTAEDAAIARQLAGIYGDDIPRALASSEAAGLRFNNALRAISDTGQEVNRGLFVEFGQNIRNGANAWEAFKNAGVSALGKISDKLMQMAADNLWKSAFGGSSSGGLSGFFGSLFGGGGSSAPTMVTGLGAGTGGLSFPMFADGTSSAPGGMAIVGERGPELVNLPRGAQVIPNHRLPSAIGNSPQNVHVTVGVTVDNDGNLQAYVKNVAQTESQKSVTGFVRSPAFTEHVAVANVKARTQRLGR